MKYMRKQDREDIVRDKRTCKEYGSVQSTVGKVPSEAGYGLKNMGGE